MEPTNGEKSHRERAGASQRPRFELGRLMATPGALGALTSDELMTGLRRHVQGDWGDLCADDRKANDAAVTHQGRILSSYRSASGSKFWVITEADRSATTVLLPDEY